jgi:hypothetical protein
MTKRGFLVTAAMVAIGAGKRRQTSMQDVCVTQCPQTKQLYIIVLLKMLHMASGHCGVRLAMIEAGNCALRVGAQRATVGRESGTKWWST